MRTVIYCLGTVVGCLVIMVIAHVVARIWPDETLFSGWVGALAWLHLIDEPLSKWRKRETVRA